MAADRRRINGPAASTQTPLFVTTTAPIKQASPALVDTDAKQSRKLFMKRGICPSATGSAYLEKAAGYSTKFPGTSDDKALKLVCTIHGPKPLSRQSTYTPVLTISTYVKFAPFASSQRKGYLRDAAERELSSNLDVALRSIVIGAKWPKSGLDVILTILEMPGVHNDESWSLMSTLSGCITVASLALLDAGLECSDLISGGFAARMSETGINSQLTEPRLLIEPTISSESVVHGACVVAYGKHRREIFSVWSCQEQGGGLEAIDSLTSTAVAAAEMSYAALELVHG